MLTVFPIILAAMPTQVSRCAERVSSKSRAVEESSFEAGFDLIPKNIGSCINSRTITILDSCLSDIIIPERKAAVHRIFLIFYAILLDKLYYVLYSIS